MKNKNSPNKKKLLSSNWTAVAPKNKEKHFTVSKVEMSEEDPQIVLYIELMVILTNKIYQIDHLDLNDKSKWIQGWK